MQSTVGQLMDRQPSAVRPEASIESALQLILEENLAELYVTDSLGRLVGVVADYDLLKAQLTGISRQDKVATLMTSSLTVLSPETLVGEAARLFRERRFSRVAVVANGRLVGEISRRTILRALAGSGIRELRVVGADEMAEATPVEGSPARPRFLDSSRAHIGVFTE